METEAQQIIHTDDLALFQIPPVNATEDRIKWVDYEPVFQNAKSSIDFQIPGTGGYYTDLSKSLLKVTISLRKKNGEIFTPVYEEHTVTHPATNGAEEADKEVSVKRLTKCCTPIDNILHSLWSMCDVKFNQALVSTSGTNYSYKAYIENVLTYSTATKDIQMELIGYSGDGGYMDQTSIDGYPESIGLLKRHKWFKRPRQNPDHDTSDGWGDPKFVEFSGTLKADVCQQNHLILNGVTMDFKLTPNKDIFTLMQFGEEEGYIQIEKIKFRVCHVAVEANTILGIENTLKKEPAVYAMTRTDIRTFNINEGTFNKTFEDIWQGEVPSKLIIGLVDAEAYAGSYEKNPFNFQSFNLASVGFYVDGEPTPTQPIELNIENGEYIDGIESLYLTTGKLNDDTDIPIDRESFREGFALLGFNVDPTSSPNMEYVGTPRSGRTRLQIRFHKGLKKQVILVVYATFPEVMQVDATRLVCLREKEKTISRIRGTPNKCIVGA